MGAVKRLTRNVLQGTASGDMDRLTSLFRKTQRREDTIIEGVKPRIAPVTKEDTAPLPLSPSVLMFVSTSLVLECTTALAPVVSGDSMWGSTHTPAARLSLSLSPRLEPLHVPHERAVGFHSAFIFYNEARSIEPLAESTASPSLRPAYRW